MSRLLLVTDQSGHIIDTLGRSWSRHANGVTLDLLVSRGVDTYELCKSAESRSGILWLDHLRFNAAGKAVRRPQIVMVHHVTSGTEEATLKALDTADCILAPCRQWQRFVSSALKRDVLLAPYSVDTDTFVRCVDPQAARVKAGLPQDAFVIGFIGKAAADDRGRKGVDLFLRVVTAYSGISKKLFVLLIGPGWNALVDDIRQAGVLVRHSEYATNEETVAAYHLMDVLIVTSREEGGPCTVLEAMACGVSVISSDVGHVREVLDDGVTGIIVSEREVGRYVCALRHLESSPDDRSRIAHAARRYVSSHRRHDIVVPRINFTLMWEVARGHFRTRRRIEHYARFVRQTYWLTRHIARRISR